MEPQNAPPSFSARRPTTSNFNIELPPPQLSRGFAPISTVQAPQVGPGTYNLGNLLTPPGQIPGDILSPMSQGTNSGNNTAANNGQPPYTPTGGYWSLPGGTGLTPFSFATGTTPQPWPQNNFGNPLFPPKGLFSPSLNSMVRNSTNSPATSDGLPPPPPPPAQHNTYELGSLPPFAPSSTSMSAPGSIPALVSQQQQQMSYINAQAPMPNPTSQPSPSHPSEPYMQRPPPTPGYYSGSQPSSTPQQGSYPGFAAPSPINQQSPMSAGPRISPTSASSMSMPQPSPQQMQFPRPYSYPLPGMSGMAGPVMSNLHNPGSNMQLVGGMGGMIPAFNSGHAAQMQMYGHQQQPPQNERPFKCDQCPQSFNRNHDLKRHKRIHLAVKPFPCGHCEKSFSRKDALKVSPLPIPLAVGV